MFVRTKRVHSVSIKCVYVYTISQIQWRRSRKMIIATKNNVKTATEAHFLPDFNDRNANFQVKMKNGWPSPTTSMNAWKFSRESLTERENVCIVHQLCAIERPIPMDWALITSYTCVVLRSQRRLSSLSLIHLHTLPKQCRCSSVSASKRASKSNTSRIWKRWCSLSTAQYSCIRRAILKHLSEQQSVGCTQFRFSRRSIW